MDEAGEDTPHNPVPRQACASRSVVLDILYSISLPGVCTAVKVNFVPDEDVKEDLYRLVARGTRSRVINDALRMELLAIKRDLRNLLCSLFLG